eukprot:CAMPEP_0168406968 /NCGR_PEP_ID=MMETSP0228-20121227/25922_1 /TAXON_ID=133427 /ORGANISM="Protoceratium reticulatum, Strain CCCM 535 (=CCMP 1889)" /LENGTH=40 /DNA_ID= /DNA_START= /DNA_END= /DNA_ORIENTATION=
MGRRVLPNQLVRSMVTSYKEKVVAEAFALAQRLRGHEGTA